jgi:magnesium transporter
MLAILKTTETGLERLEEFEPGSWIDLVSPTEEELRRVSDELNIPLDLLSGPLDEEEKSRVEMEDGLTFVVVDIPVLVVEDDERSYATIPLGMIVHPEYFITICLRVNPILGEFERQSIRGFFTYKKTRFLFQILQQISAFYLRYLYRIDRETDKLEKELRASLKNAEIFDLLNLQKALVYFTTSLRSNDLVLQKLLRGKTIKMYEEDEELLEDVIVENRQASEMAKIYTEPGDEAADVHHHHLVDPGHRFLILWDERQAAFHELRARVHARDRDSTCRYHRLLPSVLEEALLLSGGAPTPYPFVPATRTTTRACSTKR